MRRQEVGTCSSCFSLAKAPESLAGSLRQKQLLSAGKPCASSAWASSSSSGVFAGKKLKAALWKLQTEQHRLNYSRKADSDYFDRLDEQVRIVCAQYRVLKKDQLAYARLFS